MPDDVCIYWWCNHLFKENTCNWDDNGKELRGVGAQFGWWYCHKKQLLMSLLTSIRWFIIKNVFVLWKSMIAMLTGDKQQLFGIYDCWDHLMTIWHKMFMTKNTPGCHPVHVKVLQRSQKDATENRWSYRVKLEQSKSHDRTVLDLSRVFIWTFFFLNGGF